MRRTRREFRWTFGRNEDVGLPQALSRQPDVAVLVDHVVAAERGIERILPEGVVVVEQEMLLISSERMVCSRYMPSR